MIDTTTMIYLAKICGDIEFVCAVFFTVGLFSLIPITFYLISEGSPVIKKLLKKVITVVVCSAIIGTIIPDKKTVYLMSAAEKIEQFPITPKVMDALELKIDNYISELKEEK